MSTTYAGNQANNPANITIPSDGDARNAASVNVAFEGLMDKIVHTQSLVLKTQMFTSSGTWAAPAKLAPNTTITIEGFGGAGGGGGGAGGGAANTYSLGGAGGGASRKQVARLTAGVDVMAGDSCPVTIGAGGTAGTAGPAGSSGGAGGDGGDSLVTDTNLSTFLFTALGAMGGCQGQIESTAAFAAPGGRSVRSTITQNTTLWKTIKAIAASGVPYSIGDAFGGDGIPNAVGTQGFGGWNNPDSSASPGVGGLHGSNNGSNNGGGGGGGAAPGPGAAASAPSGGPGGNGSAGTGAAGTAGTSPAANSGSGGSGGGAGGSGAGGGGAGAAGAAGGSGQVKITWFEIG